MLLPSVAVVVIGLALPVEVPAQSPVNVQTNIVAASSAEPPPIEEDPILWEQRMAVLAKYICVILRCQSTYTWESSTLSEDLGIWIATYYTNGLRTDMTSTEADFAVATLIEMKYLCENDPGVVNPGVGSSFSGMAGEALDKLGFGRSQ